MNRFLFDLSYPKQLTKKLSNLHAAMTMCRMKDLNVSIFNNSINFTWKKRHRFYGVYPSLKLTFFEPENRPKPKIKVVIIPTFNFQVLH